MVFPTVAPPDLGGRWFVQTWIYIITESFHEHVNMNSSNSVVLEMKIFKWPNPIFHFCDYLPFEGELVLEKIFFSINICKHCFPYCGPFWPRGTMIWTNFNLHYIRELSCKYELYWFLRRVLNEPNPFLHFCNYLSFEEDLAHNLNNLEFSIPKDDLYQVWFKLASWFQRRFWKKIMCIFTLSLLSPLRKGSRPSYEQFWIPFAYG
jgi:hypothetical protein